MAGQIKGKQIRDDTITGDDVNEDTLILKYFTTHKYTQNNSNPVYVRFNAGGADLLGDVMSNNKFVIPANGVLKFIRIRSTQNTMGLTSISIMKLTDGQGAFGTSNGGDPETFTEVVGASLETKSVNISQQNSSFVANFDSNSFSAGDVAGIKIDPTNNHGNVDITAVWEFDWSA